MPSPCFIAFEDKEHDDSQVECVVELRPAWIKILYRNRGSDLEEMNLVEYISTIRISPKEDQANAEPPLKNYRYFLNMDKFLDLEPNDLERAAQETTELPENADMNRWFLEHYQLQECAHCGKRNGKLLVCSGCRSFCYCNTDHQQQHWKEHKHICLKRKKWED